MTKTKKPKIGLLGLITDGYESVFPGILVRQKKYGKEIAKSLAEYVDITFDDIATNRNKIEEIVGNYNHMGLDGILIVLLAYSQGAWLVRAMEKNNLPLAVAVIQPDDVAEINFEELDLTVNQGIHGAQDNCNVLMRLGIPFQVFAGSRHSEEFKCFVSNFGHAAQGLNLLKNMKVGVLGRMQGMGDILTDEMALFKKLGVEICHDSLGVINRFIKALDPSDIEAEVKEDAIRFNIDPNLSTKSHQIAVGQYLGFREYLLANNYQAFTAHFDMFGQDGRFRQLPLYAASRLMADGYGYAAEGDVTCAALLRLGHFISQRPANFTEMYMIDKKSDSILFCHAGEGNYSAGVDESKPNLIDRYLGEGGLENPPTILFQQKPGPATLVSLVSLSGTFRLIVAKGKVIDRYDLKGCEMPYLFFRPDSGTSHCVEQWLKQGGTHHEVLCSGDVASRFKMLCEMTEIEYVEV
ncbi:MAG: arabinose isomerase [Defluviitaleaceae bacterium]|nr:arabinose isomerase [Defluviitaleaceae bacterium]